MKNRRAEFTFKKLFLYTLYFTLFFSQGLKASSLWCLCSKLKWMLKIKENIDISQFYNVLAYIKRSNVGYKPKKSPVFSRAQLDQFLVEGFDDTYFMMKVVAIFGKSGACRRVELYRLCVEVVTEEGAILVFSHEVYGNRCE
ncbi:hypothetical protein RN001_001709 [Aquatica leii]|uniref:Uncharacterized protein n=1 Tax=Aquatica leii TaxID=1421715 RepID=A0AAN7QN14_9COLE|nr:hypothetical protein RN001_001709 [Aquatica leii]